jgi:aminoglycoside 2''-phosphotransferase
MKSPLPPLDQLRRVARSAWPGDRIRRFRVDETGWTNLVLEGDGRWIFRFPRWSGAARALGAEVRLLEFLGRHVSTPVPVPILVGTLTDPPGWPFMAYEKLPGTPMQSVASLSRSERAGLTKFLLRLFSELEACPDAPLRRMGLARGDRRAWGARFGHLRRRFVRIASRRVPHQTEREVLRWFREFHETLADSRYRPVLLHGDLWPSHVLWDSKARRPTGVIDWEDGRFGDPAFDLCMFGELGSGYTEQLIGLRRAASDRNFEKRLAFYRRILPLHGLLFGLETHRPALFRRNLRDLQTAVS